MRTEQLALLVALVVLANVALLAALAMPRLNMRRGLLDVPGSGQRTPSPAAPRAGSFQPAGPYDADLPPQPRGLNERVVRVVSYLFIGSALVVVTVIGGTLQPLMYLLLAIGAFMIVLSQDLLPMDILGRWRFSVEVTAAIVFISTLVVLSGGYQSPFFFGYVLLLAGASLRAEGAGPVLLGLATAGAYLVAITLAPGLQPMDPRALGLIGFNLVSLALISYVAAVIGREQRRAQEAALRLSRFDPLTGVFSRMYFGSAMQAEILRAVRTGRPFSLLMMDLDGLKPVNDRFGHEFGDRLLRAVGDVIRRGIRLTDIAARYGGDEFVVILPETDLDGAIRVSEKLRLDIAELTLPQSRSVIQTSVSIGLVTYPDDGRTGSELMRRADHAMYEAKRRGRNQIVHYPRPVQRRQLPAAQPAEQPGGAQPPHNPGRQRAPVGPGRAPWQSPVQPPVPPSDPTATDPTGGPADGVQPNGNGPALEQAPPRPEVHRPRG